jgi:predicted  nucleic acid-binding Zn-ribbon protein
MLIWWIISLIVLIGCFIFAYRMIVSTYEYLPEGKKHLMVFRKNSVVESTSVKGEIIWDLKNKLQQMEENASFYEIQFSKLQQRLKTLEVQQISQQQKNSNVDDEENWKDLYYEENEIKEKLENELDTALRKLEVVENKLNSIEETNSNSVALQSEYDARLNEIVSLQNNIDTLERKIEAAVGREKELGQLLNAENRIKSQYEQLKHDLTRLKIENEDLRKQIVEMDKREKEFENNVARLHELESKLSVYEEEKFRMITTLEQMVQQNKVFGVSKT